MTGESEWHQRWMRVAETYASFSKDPSTKVGAVAVIDRRVVSAGWNGFPRGVVDDDRLLDREKKYEMTVHAEMNCVYNACYAGTSLCGSTVYVHGLQVCHECAKGLVQAGVKSVVMRPRLDPQQKWVEEFNKTKSLFAEVGVDWYTLTA